jgi:hypothetical protein
MRLFLFFLVLYISSIPFYSQELYFLPLTGSTWSTVDPGSLGWCADRVDSLLQFVEAHHSKSFIILKDGKIAVEGYFVTVKMPAAIEQLTLWDSQGRRLRQSMPKETQVMVDLRSLPKGVYLLQFYTRDGMGTARVVKE